MDNSLREKLVARQEKLGESENRQQPGRRSGRLGPRRIGAGLSIAQLIKQLVAVVNAVARWKREGTAATVRRDVILSLKAIVDADMPQIFRGWHGCTSLKISAPADLASVVQSVDQG